jgi:hypothetical protein
LQTNRDSISEASRRQATDPPASQHPPLHRSAAFHCD